METTMSYETILVETHGAVTLITLNRPKALNALNSQVCAELVKAFAAFEADDTQGCAVLTGSGDKALQRVPTSRKWPKNPPPISFWAISLPIGRRILCAPPANRGSRRSTVLHWAAAANWR
jgi:hypothetical protein